MRLLTTALALASACAVTVRLDQNYELEYYVNNGNFEAKMTLSEGPVYEDKWTGIGFSSGTMYVNGNMVTTKTFVIASSSGIYLYDADQSTEHGFPILRPNQDDLIKKKYNYNVKGKSVYEFTMRINQYTIPPGYETLIWAYGQDPYFKYHAQRGVYGDYRSTGRDIQSAQVSGNKIQLVKDYTLEYSISGNVMNGQLTQTAKPGGWAGIGFTRDDPSMQSTELFIVAVNNEVMLYDAASSVHGKPSKRSDQSLLISSSSSNSVYTFSLNMSGIPDGADNLIWAYGVNQDFNTHFGRGNYGELDLSSSAKAANGNLRGVKLGTPW